MNNTEIRKLFLKLFIAFLVLTALIAIVLLLKGDFGWFEGKILLTTFTISASSIGSMACAAFVEKRKLVELGYAGMGLSIGAGVLVIVGIWPDINSELYWKTTASLIVLAIAMAHSFLLALPTLGKTIHWLQSIAFLTIGLLTIQILGLVWAEWDSDFYFRLLIIISVLVALETLVIPILMKLKADTDAKELKLVLNHLEGDLYQDGEGKKYRVLEIPANEK